MKLNIGAKVNALIVLAIILVGGGSLFLSVSALKEEGNLAKENYSSAVINEKKSQIKDLVNSAYTLAKERLDAALDKEKLRNQYGEQEWVPGQSRRRRPSELPVIVALSHPPWGVASLCPSPPLFENSL